ncbi:uncharacterized protein LOC101852489 [Aplysia californica]|uniref:Uncharacterized protein LOC101852489 n=1 Tax=Aplysia californica TaxID=6500 RepID=A0ABM1A4D5_APLCA|nr:uncharacterized protein LOC101852489 [Aplysia californica]
MSLWRIVKIKETYQKLSRNRHVWLRYSLLMSLILLFLSLAIYERSLHSSATIHSLLDKSLWADGQIAGDDYVIKLGKNPRGDGQNISDKRVRYIVYTCDGTYCHGLGDRQRAIVSLYYLSIVTNRKLVINMTQPWPLSDFYEPSETDWTVNEDELKDRSSTYLVCLGKRGNQIKWDSVNFNKMYPQDVVYIMTNHDFYYQLRSNSLYQSKLPIRRKWRAHGEAWKAMMHPTAKLRSALNDELTKIGEVILEEKRVYSETNLSSTNCKAARAHSLGKSMYKEKRLLKQTDVEHSPTQKTQENESRIDVCRFPPPRFQYSVVSLSPIKSLRGYDVINMDLVCAHVRIGRSDTLPQEEYQRNDPDSVGGLWRFLQPYMKAGHHAYLATDSQQVRDQAKLAFGHRMHVSEQEIVHFGKTGLEEDNLRLALTEQLLLSTACSVLVISKSGYSMRAAMLRATLQGDDGLFFFKNGTVREIDAAHLF